MRKLTKKQKTTLISKKTSHRDKKMMKIAYCFLLLILSITSQAQYRRYKSYNCNGIAGKVKYEFYTNTEGLFYEQKVKTIAYLCNIYLQTYHKNTPDIYLSFRHQIPEPIVHIGYNKITWFYIEPCIFKNKDSCQSDMISIYEETRIFSLEETLRALDYVVENVERIKQQPLERMVLEYGNVMCFINATTIKAPQIAVNERTKNQINEILNIRINEDVMLPTYYFQNDKYHFINPLTNNVYLELENIYQIIPLNEQEKIIFETDTSFYYFSPRNNELTLYSIAPRDRYGTYYCSKYYLMSYDYGEIILSYKNYNEEKEFFIKFIPAQKKVFENYR